MAFVSLAFIAFMAVVLAVYFVTPSNGRWIVLLVASYVFFWINSEWLIAALFVQTLGTFLFGLWIQRIEDNTAPEIAATKDKTALRALKVAVKKRKQRVMTLGIIFNLGALLTMKYYNFFADNANMLLMAAGIKLPSLGIAVPIGLSFYTLQAIAYLVDLRRAKMTADTNLFKFMLFMSYFPQILQGPIPRHTQLAHQLYEGHTFDTKRACYGMQLILWGFMKKLILADRLAIPVNQVFDNWQYYDGLIVFLAAACYGIQVYADFSGGIDIARGFSQMLGIELVDNFRQPYFSKSITELWRRWHITLGNWMRDYVFYPLSMAKGLGKIGKAIGKACGASLGRKFAPCLATFIVFILVGFWHGANWTFIAYGIWNGVFITLATLIPEFYALLKRKLHIDEESAGWLFFQMFRTFIIVSLGRFFSRATTMTQALGMAGSITVGWYDLSFLVDGSLTNLGLNVANWVVLFVMLLILLSVDIAHERGFAIRDFIARQGIVARWLIYLTALAAVLVFGVYGTGYDAASFIYQQF